MNILLAINDNYIEQTMVLLYSIFFNKQNRNIGLHIYFLGSRLSKKNKQRIYTFINENGGMVNFVEVDESLFQEAPQRNHISIETYYRLLAFKLLPEVDKILYLDADILVVGSLKRLYCRDMKDKCIAGVADQGEVQYDKVHKSRLGVSMDTVYINGGVLLMNLKRMREIFSIESILEYIAMMGKVLKYQDQDVINSFFADEILLLPKKYNQAPLYENLTDFRDYFIKKRIYPTIIHYMGEDTKPWKERLYGYKYMRIYYGYCRLAGCKKLLRQMTRGMLLRPFAIVKQYEKEIGMRGQDEK